MRYRVLPHAKAEIDAIWLYIATESGSKEIANRLIQKITNRYWLLVENPRAGRRRDHDLGANLRSFPVGEYVIIYRIEDSGPLILRVTRGSRDLKALIIN